MKQPTPEEIRNRLTHNLYIVDYTRTIDPYCDPETTAAIARTGQRILDALQENEIFVDVPQHD